MTPDAHYAHPRLAALYDPLEPDRPDLAPYLDLAAELGARRVLDLGCGTGVLALLLAERGLDVVGLDPAAASLAVAAGRPGADRVRWVHGDARALVGLAPPIVVDLVTMTGNAAQAVTDDDEWGDLLRAAHDVRGAPDRPGLEVVFLARRPPAGG